MYPGRRRREHVVAETQAANGQRSVMRSIVSALGANTRVRHETISTVHPMRLSAAAPVHFYAAVDVQARIEGRSRRVHIARHSEMDLAEARRRARDMLDRVRAGENPADDIQREKPTPTFGEKRG